MIRVANYIDDRSDVVLLLPVDVVLLPAVLLAWLLLPDGVVAVPAAVGPVPVMKRWNISEF